METLTQFLGWAAPIASTLIVTALSAQINVRARRDEQAANERHEETVAKRRAEQEWRKIVDARMRAMDGKLDSLNDATQTTMRTQLIHYAQKFIARGWITGEERASWQDMYEKYSALNANGLIEGYHHRVSELPEGNID